MLYSLSAAFKELGRLALKYQIPAVNNQKLKEAIEKSWADQHCLTRAVIICAACGKRLAGLASRFSISLFYACGHAPAGPACA